MFDPQQSNIRMKCRGDFYCINRHPYTKTKFESFDVRIIKSLNIR